MRKHKREGYRPAIDDRTMSRVEEYHKAQGARGKYMSEPIVPPETHTIDFTPNTYELIRETVYEDEEREEKAEIGIGPEPEPEPEVFRYRDNASGPLDNSFTISNNPYNSLN